jgi:hypothetical protein
MVLEQVFASGREAEFPLTDLKSYVRAWRLMTVLPDSFQRCS